MPTTRRGVASRNFPCGISGCPRYTLRRANKLCATCWREYGSIKPRPKWLQFLMNWEERERYREEVGDGQREVSLESLLYTGHVELDALELFRSPPSRPRKPRRRHYSRRGRPRKQAVTAPIQSVVQTG